MPLATAGYAVVPLAAAAAEAAAGNAVVPLAAAAVVDIAVGYVVAVGNSAIAPTSESQRIGEAIGSLLQVIDHDLSSDTPRKIECNKNPH